MPPSFFGLVSPLHPAPLHVHLFAASRGSGFLPTTHLRRPFLAHARLSFSADSFRDCAPRPPPPRAPCPHYLRGGFAQPFLIFLAACDCDTHLRPNASMQPTFVARALARRCPARRCDRLRLPGTLCGSAAPASRQQRSMPCPPAFFVRCSFVAGQHACKSRSRAWARKQRCVMCCINRSVPGYPQCFVH